jgi:hypothetical protein
MYAAFCANSSRCLQAGLFAIVWNAPNVSDECPMYVDLLVYNYSRYFLTFPPARVAIKLNLLTLSA